LASISASSAAFRLAKCAPLALCGFAPRYAHSSHRPMSAYHPQFPLPGPWHNEAVNRSVPGRLFDAMAYGLARPALMRSKPLDWRAFLKKVLPRWLLPPYQASPWPIGPYHPGAAKRSGIWVFCKATVCRVSAVRSASHKPGTCAGRNSCNNRAYRMPAAHYLSARVISFCSGDSACVFRS